MEDIAVVQSLVAARKLMDEIAVQGKWSVAGQNEHAVIYQKRSGSSAEQLEIMRDNERRWRVVKTLHPKEPVSPSS